ncbi:MAG: 1-acyl-sn-glycerol-3-phosphate acyltransferase [Reyranella sp.]|uniref:lysophospholipid acyltransferase family protein n=1 Tax=Reyranella sp. TaxID=1929291 RepID=UPI001212FF28|nr:lysophospholipid acyltransferase family protein [Reyranella sp.]TAJ41545.1 MAG: 1-acyl-sn-glycerol-3-phosphate acyltransferase [Reyranella sp.]
MIRSLSFNAFFYLGTLLTAVIGIVLVPIPTPVVLRGVLHHWARAVVWGMRWIGGMKVEFRGPEHLPATGPVLLAGKHHSECDGILLAARIPGIAFVAMQEIFSYPLIGAILYRLQMIRVDACGGGKERENLAQFAKRACDSGRHIAIYPEGNLMAPGERERYRSGIYYLYRDLGLPVTPVATSVGLVWNRRDWWKKPGRAAIEFLPAIETGLDKQTFMRRLEETLETASDRLIAEFSGRPHTPSQLVLRSQGQSGSVPPASAPLAQRTHKP